MSLHLKRLLVRWRAARVGQVAEKPAPDPADCGTAWGLELTVPPPRPYPPTAPRPPRR